MNDAANAVFPTQLTACGRTRRIIIGQRCPFTGELFHRCNYGAPGHKLHICGCGKTWEDK